MSRNWRVAAAGIILAGLVFFFALLTPAYWRNWQFTRQLEAVCEERAATNVTSDVIRAEVEDRAGRMGIPLKHDEIRITGPTQGRLEIEVLYVVRVDLGIYTADLHFRPRVRQ